MKALHDFAKTLSDALAAMEGAKAAEDRARDARLAEGRARSELEAAKSEAVRVKSEAGLRFRNTIADLEKIEAGSAAKIAAEKAQHEKWLADTKRISDEESGRLAAIKTEIVLERTRLNDIMIAIAKQRANLAELAAKF